MRRFAEAVVRYRHAVLVAAFVVTVALGLQLRRLDVIVDADELLPKHHPFVEVTERVEALFGDRFTVVIGVSPHRGDIYSPDVLDKLIKVTDALAATPGVTARNLGSLAAPRAKDVMGAPEGVSVARLLDRRPADAAAARRVAQRLADNPVYRNILVSRDGRTAAIYAEVRKDPAGFGAVMARVQAAVAPIRDSSVDVHIAGQPVFLAAIETYSKRMGLLLPLAVVVIGLIHFEAFRTVQGLVLPLVTALLSVVWALGLMTMAGQHLDPFNNITPILILAIAAGHAVQVLKRYYEEYGRLRRDGVRDARAASRQAVAESLCRVGPVMLAAGTIAALSFLSLAAFPIPSIRGFGVFAAAGIVSIVLIEFTFTPALRALLPPPSAIEAHAERAETAWDRLAAKVARQVSTARGRRRLIAAWAAIFALFVAGASLVRVDNSLRGFLGANEPARQDDRFLNSALAGSNTFYVLVEGDREDALKDPAVLRGVEAVQAFLEREPEVGRAVSIVDFLKQINRAMHGGDPAFAQLPADRETISQYLLLYSLSGDPGDFGGVVDEPYRNAVVQAFVKTDSSAYVASLNRRILPVIQASFPPGVRVRLGGSITTPTAMNDVMVRGKLINILQLAAVVFVVGALIFRSAQMGLLILAPLVATALGVFAVMGFAHIPLQIATATVSALAVGIGADYAIYLACRLREELARSEESEAIRVTFASSGKAVMFVASAVAGGYAVLMASVGFNVHFWLGLLVSLAMIIAAASTLSLFAALLVSLKPKAIYGRPRIGAPSPGLSPVTAALAIGVVASLATVATSRADTLPRRAKADGSAAIAAGAKAKTPAPPQETWDAAAVMASSSRATKALRSTASARFILSNSAGQTRERDTTSLSELKADGVSNRRLIRFNTPADIRGSALLTVENPGAEDDIWVYLPALRKVRRLSAANKKDAFLGTDFSYGDILGYAPEQWTHRMLRTEVMDGQPVRVIESWPRDALVSRESGYGRRVTWVRAADAVALKVEYYDLRGDLLKVYAGSDVRQVDPVNHRFQAMRQQMSNVQTGHSTVIVFTAFDATSPIPADRFSPRALEAS